MKDKLNYTSMVSNIQDELETYIKAAKLKSLVIGISGGIDSALCSAIAMPVCDKLNIPLIGRSIPISTNTSDERDRADLVGNAFCHNYDEAYMAEGAFKAFRDIVKVEELDVEDINEKIRLGNIKARIRMIYLYDLAQLHKGMVLSTDNYTELKLGFWTLHGDVGDYGMLQNIWKTEVYDLAEYLVGTLPPDKAKALQSCIDCQATDGLGISGTDLDQIMPGWEGSSRDGYKKVDEILSSYLNDETANRPAFKQTPVIRRCLGTEFKRNNPFNIKRSLIIPPDEIEYKKKVITISVHQHNQNKPYTQEYIQNLKLLPADEVFIEWQEEEFRSDGGSPAGFYISVTRSRLETDEELDKRIREHKTLMKKLKDGRYKNYLRAIKEFEK